MQPLVSAMTFLKQSVVAAIIKQLLRGKSLLQSLFSFWLSPASSKSKIDSASSSSPSSSTAVDLDGKVVGAHAPGLRRSPEDFIREVENLILGPLAGDGILRLSRGLKAQFRQDLQENPECMLPSYSHVLPDGCETGRYLALDVGGSTMRVALVELRGQGEDVKGRESEIDRMQSFPITKKVKELQGVAFFDWMAARIVETLAQEEEGRRQRGDGPLPISLSWSFPIEQTSLRSGRIHGMGKGLRAAEGLEGQDLSAVVEEACLRAGLKAELLVILNDGNATLISRAYTHPTTRFGLILGTGVNIAAYLPVPLVGAAKFGDRPRQWFDEAQSVIVNTELSMFGRGVLPVTRWDASLKEGHPMPDFQPLEHMVSGMYLGEIARFVILEAIRTTGVLGAVVPEVLNEPYSFDTRTMSIVEGDTSPEYETSIDNFATSYPSPHRPTPEDIAFLRSLFAHISGRSAGIIAASLHAIWELRLEGIREDVAAAPSPSISSSSPPLPSPSSYTSAEAHKAAVAKATAAKAELNLERTMIAFNGSVIESYPGYRELCQGFIDGLVAASRGNLTAADEGVNGSGDDKASSGRRAGVGIDLVPAGESSILGAGIALAAAVHGSAHA